MVAGCLYTGALYPGVTAQHYFDLYKACSCGRTLILMLGGLVQPGG